MIQSLRARWAIIFAVLALTVIWTVPNFVDTEKIWWPTQSKMVLGLDIQGGSHLVLRVDVDGAVKQETTRMATELPNQMSEQEKFTVKSSEVSDPIRGQIKIEANSPEDVEKVRTFLEKYYGNTIRIDDVVGPVMNVSLAELFLREFKSNLLDQAIATIRNRIDEFGVAEPSITAQGSDRILVQLPGIKDASSAKELINRTARLDFMLIDTSVSQADLTQMIQDAEKEHNFKFTDMKYSAYVDRLNEVLKGKIPANTVIYFEKPEDAVSLEAGRVPFLVRLDEVVPGSHLTNARIQPNQYGRPEVAFQFDAVGAKINGDMTGRNLGKAMAIVLDKVVKSTPVIQARITDSGVITLGGSPDPQESMRDAKLISTALRAGALPASLEQVEERTVGPSLGHDAIQKGQVATLVAAVAVFVFMIIFYKSFGLIADIALALNLLGTVAILSSLGATLTLPGVAGLALTLGISVDASVIIFERIKEELGKGTNLAAAIREGYDKAFSSIFDSNLTSIAVCLVLMYYGTGPVRGFAITLVTGLLITMFTAVFFTRTVLDFFVGKLKWNLSVK